MPLKTQLRLCAKTHQTPSYNIANSVICRSYLQSGLPVRVHAGSVRSAKR